MGFAGLSYLAVFVAAVASFAFGAAYYMALAKPWMSALDKTEEDVRAGAGPVTYSITFLAQLLMAYILAGMIGHLGAENVSARSGVISGALVWLGFVATTLIVNHGFQGAKRSLTLIDGGHWLGVLVIQGLVIGLIGV